MVTGSEDGEPPDYDVEPYLMSILSEKFRMVTREMSQTLLKSGRSGTVNVARDFSNGITLYDGRQFIIDEGLPVHAANFHLTPEYLLEHFDDVAPGDCFLINSPYAGCTHHADYTLAVPVFYDDEPMFWAINRTHQADCGAPEPTTYPPEAATVYEEGPHYPGVRVQADYEDREDVVRTLAANVRLGETQWYGDFRGQVAAVRKGERKIQQLCEEYSAETVEAFASAWLDYGRAMMCSEVADLPAETVSYSAAHDAVPGAPDGVPVNVEVEIGEETIRVDVTDNVPNIPSGFNLTEATTIAAVYTGIFNVLDASIPHNHGAIEQVDVEMDDGKVVGRPEFPVGTAVATTNVCSVLINAVQAAFASLGEPYGLSEARTGNLNIPVLHGTDPRNDDAQFITQIFPIAGGGPAGHGTDGWLRLTSPSGGGVPYRDSLEIDEQKYPIVFERNELLPDTAGAGRWRGAPGSVVEYRPRENPMQASFNGNHEHTAAAGVRGGEAAALAEAYKVTDDDREPLSFYGTVEVTPGESVVTKDSGGGGYGDPRERDVERVRRDVANGLVSVEAARESYGVAVEETDAGYELDVEATAALRGIPPEEVRS